MSLARADQIHAVNALREEQSVLRGGAGVDKAPHAVCEQHIDFLEAQSTPVTSPAQSGMLHTCPSVGTG